MWPTQSLQHFELQLLVPIIVVGFFSLVAASTDLWKLKVHNVLVFPLLLTGLGYHTVCSSLTIGSPWPGLQVSMLGLAFGFGVLLVPYVMGGMTGADIKLMAAIGAWLGFELTVVVFLVSSLAAGAASAFKVLWYNSLDETCQNLRIMWHRVVAFWRYLSAEDNIENAIHGDDRHQRAIPFGAMLAVGILATAILVCLKLPL